MCVCAGSGFDFIALSFPARAHRGGNISRFTAPTRASEFRGGGGGGEIFISLSWKKSAAARLEIARRLNGGLIDF